MAAGLSDPDSGDVLRRWSLGAVLATSELETRPVRKANRAAEADALLALADVLSESPHAVLQRLVEIVADCCRAGSAGVSLLEEHGGEQGFRWVATAGRLKADDWGLMPYAESPCAVILESNACQLLVDPVRRFPGIVALPVPAVEILLAPFHRDGRAIGTVWVVSHEGSRRFDREDVRFLTNLARFAAAATRAVSLVSEANHSESEIRIRDTRSQFLVDLNTALQPLADPQQIMSVAARLLGEHLQADRCAYAEVEDDGNHFHLIGDYSPGASSLVGRYALGDFGPDVLRLNRAGEAFVAVDTEHDERLSDYRETYRAAEIQAVISHPLHKDGKFVAGMAVHQRRPRAWKKAEVEVVGMVAGRCWESLERLRVLRQLHESEMQLEQRRRLYEAILSSTPDLVYVFDRDHRFAYANQSLLTMWGRTWDESIGKTCLELGYPDWHAAMHDREIDQVIATARPIRGEVGFEGTYGPRIYDYIFVPVIGADGSVESVAGTTRDVTERRRAEEALRESEQRYRLVGHAANDAIWDWDLVTNKVVWNPGVAACFGFTLEQILPDASWWIGHIHPDDRDRVSRSIHAVIDGDGEMWSDEYRFARADGTYAYVFDRGQVLRDESGKPLRMVGSMLDLTERREAEQRKDEFLATLAHELRNPLAPIRNMLELMKRSDIDAGEMHEARDMMDRQLTHMVRLIDDLLDLSRISRGKIELKRERSELSSIVYQAVEAARPLITSMGHELTIKLPHEPLMLDVDPVRLAQVFGNLLNNACKYTPAGGQVELSAHREGSDVVVRVKDSGVGLEPEMQAKIFEMFIQVDRSLERSQGGLGIGLTLVRRLVELHDGSVLARSDGIGHGSEFVVRLPLLIEARKVRPPDVAPSPASTQCRRILVVDDNRDAATTLSLLLTLAKHETAVAYDGLEAVDVAERVRPEVILLDIGLPGISGYDACRRIREQPWGKEIFIVALTGWGQDEDRRKSHEAGFSAHLVKPVDYATLAALLAQIEPVDAP